MKFRRCQFWRSPLPIKPRVRWRNRVENLLGLPMGAMMMGTFHGLCHRLLRTHFEEAGLPKSFEIIDSDDQYRMIRRILKELELDEAYWPPKQLQWAINHHKEEGRDPRTSRKAKTFINRLWFACSSAMKILASAAALWIFRNYYCAPWSCSGTMKWCARPGKIAFSMCWWTSFRTRIRFNINGLSCWPKTVTTYLRWVMMINRSMVGACARVENLLNFEQDFPGATVVRLEQNYRSTSTILSAANSVIAHNDGRMGKELWTEGEDGEAIQVYGASNDLKKHATWLNKLKAGLQAGNARDSVAVLYRSNAQSRVLEEKLMQARIPYRVYGGLRFFERAEIKDALAYMRPYC